MLTLLTPTKNESWIIGLTSNVNAKFFDLIIYYDQHSSDDTVKIINRIKTAKVFENFSKEFNEAQRQLDLISLAREHGARCFFALDADEVMLGDPNSFSNVSKNIVEGSSVCMEWINISPNLLYYWSAGYKRFGYIDKGHAHAPSIFHSERVPAGDAFINLDDFSVIHLQYINGARFLNKHIEYIERELRIDSSQNRLQLFKKYSHMIFSEKKLCSSNLKIYNFISNNDLKMATSQMCELSHQNKEFLTELLRNDEYILLTLIKELSVFSMLTTFEYSMSAKSVKKILLGVLFFCLKEPRGFVKKVVFKILSYIWKK